MPPEESFRETDDNLVEFTACLYPLFRTSLNKGSYKSTIKNGFIRPVEYGDLNFLLKR